MPQMAGVGLQLPHAKGMGEFVGTRGLSTLKPSSLSSPKEPTLATRRRKCFHEQACKTAPRPQRAKGTASSSSSEASWDVLAEGVVQWGADLGLCVGHCHFSYGGAEQDGPQTALVLIVDVVDDQALPPGEADADVPLLPLDQVALHLPCVSSPQRAQQHTRHAQHRRRAWQALLL